jgi:hypothetical protein
VTARKPGSRQHSPAPLAGVAARHNANEELGGEGRLRNRSEPGQVTQAGFGPARIAVTQRVSGCYCAPARDGRLWRLRASEVRQTKDAERRDKVSAWTGKDTRSRQDS